MATIEKPQRHENTESLDVTPPPPTMNGDSISTTTTIIMAEEEEKLNEFPVPEAPNTETFKVTTSVAALVETAAAPTTVIKTVQESNNVAAIINVEEKESPPPSPTLMTTHQFNNLPLSMQRPLLHTPASMMRGVGNPYMPHNVSSLGVYTPNLGLPSPSNLNHRPKQRRRRHRQRSNRSSHSAIASSSRNLYKGATAPRSSILSSRATSSMEDEALESDVYLGTQTEEELDLDESSTLTMTASEDTMTDTESLISVDASQQQQTKLSVTDLTSVEYILKQSPKSKGLVGLKDVMTKWDALCPYCLEETSDQRSRHVDCLCCSRLTHMECLQNNTCELNMALQSVNGCIQCLRPARLVNHDSVLLDYAKRTEALFGVKSSDGATAFELAERQNMAHDADILNVVESSDDDEFSTDAENNPVRSAVRHGLKSGTKKIYYGVLETAIRAKGLKTTLQKLMKPDNTNQLDPRLASTQGITMRMLLMDAGWPLEIVVKEFGMTKASDDLWQKLNFDRTTLLDMKARDMLFFMQHLNFHPWQVRKIFEVEMEDLWKSSMSRGKSPNATIAEANLSSSKPMPVRCTIFADHAYEHEFKRTEELCLHHRVLTPDQMSILGFDFHHLLAMGFVNVDDFLKWPYYSMADWIYKLGFSLPHWDIVGIKKEDFAKGSSLNSLRGWDLVDLLTSHWKVTATDRVAMGCLGQAEMDRTLREGLERTAPTPPSQASPVVINKNNLPIMKSQPPPHTNGQYQQQPMYRQAPAIRSINTWNGNPYGGGAAAAAAMYQPNSWARPVAPPPYAAYPPPVFLNARRPTNYTNGSGGGRKSPQRRHQNSNRRRRRRPKKTAIASAAPRRPLPPPAKASSALTTPISILKH